MGNIYYAGVGFANILLVGTVYAASALQAQLPRLLDIHESLSFAPFGIACLGLSLGVVLCHSLLHQRKAHLVAGQGTLLYGAGVILVGCSLRVLNLTTMLAGCFLAGIGVGITYLAVVILLGGLFPNQALARSAIGPLGFSSGAALCFACENYLNFGSLEAPTLGSYIIWGGIACLAIGTLTFAFGDRAAHLEGLKPAGPVPKRAFFSVLLFFNALPGMTLFSGLFPILSSHVHQNSMRYLPYGLVALGLGGVLSPTLNSILGARDTFILLLLLRGLLMISATQYSATWVLGVTFVTILFSHGAGFSLLPGLVKAQSTSPQAFSRNYGQILVSWGISGLVACLLNALFLPFAGGEGWLSILLGSAVLSLGTTYLFLEDLW